MPNRYTGNSDYKYGMNGMEKDNEVHNQNGTSYTTNFRQYDSRIGRWLSSDPVTHEHMSPYNAFDNNPIIIADPTGADGEGKLQNGTYYLEATVYFRFDPALNLTNVQKLDYMTAYQDNVRGMWNKNAANGLNGNAISAEYVDFVEAPASMTEGALAKNENLITVGAVAPANGPSVSHVNGKGSSAKTGWMSYANNGSEGGHEFGHMLGLSDRYEEALTLNRQRGSSVFTVGGRATIPLLVGDEALRSDYTLNNMANGGLGSTGIFTQNQLSIAMDRTSSESDYGSGFLFIPPLRRSNTNFSFTGIDVPNGGVPIDQQGNNTGLSLKSSTIRVGKNQNGVHGLTNQSSQYGRPGQRGNANNTNQTTIQNGQRNIE